MEPSAEDHVGDLPQELCIADLVEVHGLKGAKELNGRWGRIVTLIKETLRAGVKLDGVEEPKSIKLSNLRRVEVSDQLSQHSQVAMPAAFMQAIPGTPVFKLLLRFLPAEALFALACCQVTLNTEVQSAEEAWEQAIRNSFGGHIASARRRCLGAADSARATFIALAAGYRALGKVEVVRGDLRDAARLGVDAAVCPANASLEPYGPAARAIFEEAGDELIRYMAGIPRPVDVGTACWTPGFGLGTQGLIHAVGPDRSTPYGDRKLREAYAAAFAQVKEHGHNSVAVGSISTGGNGFQVDLAAQIATEEMRTAIFTLFGPAKSPRIVIVAFDEEVEVAFRSSLRKIRRYFNEDLLEELPLIALDSMLPRQRLQFNTDHAHTALHPDCDRFAMVGLSSGQRGTLIPAGVEVHVQSRSSMGGKTELEVVGGRRFFMPGFPQREDSPRDAQGRFFFQASVAWDREEDETPTRSDLSNSTGLEPLVATWLSLVRAGHERQAGQMDMILKDLGPMPPAKKLTERALWVCALINPLPGLGVAYEIRPSVLMANTARKRLDVATEGLRASIAHLDGSKPMR